MTRLVGLLLLLAVAAFAVRTLLRGGRRKTAIFAVLVLAAYLTWPPGALVLDEECRPENLVYQASAAIHGRRFWSTQFEHLKAERDAGTSETRRAWLAKCEHAAEVRSEQG